MKHLAIMASGALSAGILLFTGCSKQAPPPATNVVDLGEVNIVSGTPIHEDLGGGKSCVMSPTIITNGAATLIQMRMEITVPDGHGGTQTMPCPMAVSLPGATAEWRVGDLDIHLKPKIQ